MEADSCMCIERYFWENLIDNEVKWVRRETIWGGIVREIDAGKEKQGDKTQSSAALTSN